MEIPLRFLLDSSRTIVGEYELSRLNHAANLRKELRAVVEQIIDDTAEARFARWLLDHAEELRCTVVSVDAGEEPLEFGETAKREGVPKTGAARRFGIDAAD